MGSAWTFRGAAALAVVCAFAAGAAAQEEPTPDPDVPEEPYFYLGASFTLPADEQKF